MVESFNKRGYKSDGSRLVEDGKPPLYGSLQIIPRNTVLTIKYSEILEETDLVVHSISSPRELEKAERGMEWRAARNRTELEKAERGMEWRAARNRTQLQKAEKGMEWRAARNKAELERQRGGWNGVPPGTEQK